MQEYLLTAEHLTKHYRVGGNKRNPKLLHALDDVSIAVRPGEIYGIVGESGCGKSTLGRCLLRLTDLTDGKIVFDGKDISKLDRRGLKPLRRDMQLIFQNPYSSFDPKYRLGVSLREVGRAAHMSDDEINEKLNTLMDTIALPRDMLTRSPSELSGGQLQRLAIARALLPGPKFIVADEPVSALDVSVQAQILNLLVDLRKQLNMTMLFISHEMTVVEHLCDRVAVMYLGQIVENAPTKTLFANLLHPYTRALMSAIPKADPDDHSERILLSGEIPSAIDIPKGCRFAGRCSHATERCLNEVPTMKEVEPDHFVSCFLY
ncbi:MAG: ABC transporter ATP-binding protein [Clostridia bacterium]|nr:ABC transporter ATP-binding protein [Clostridia bacterium]